MTLFWKYDLFEFYFLFLWDKGLLNIKLINSFIRFLATTRPIFGDYCEYSLTKSILSAPWLIFKPKITWTLTKSPATSLRMPPSSYKELHRQPYNSKCTNLTQCICRMNGMPPKSHLFSVSNLAKTRKPNMTSLRVTRLIRSLKHFLTLSHSFHQG